MAFLNLCTDQMLVLLAPERIAALSMLERDPCFLVSRKRPRISPPSAGSAEAVLRLHPISFLRHRAAYGRRSPSAQERIPPTRALVWEPRGFTAGPAGLMDAVLQAAGLGNDSDGRRFGVEALLPRAPNLLVVPSDPSHPSLAAELLHHPRACPSATPRDPAGADDLRLSVQRGGGGDAGAMIRWLALLLATPSVISLSPVHRCRHARPVGWADFLGLRLPRTLLGLLVGRGLRLSGAVLQGALRNPLADPGAWSASPVLPGWGADHVLWGFAKALPPALLVGGPFGAGIGAAFLLGFAGLAPSGPTLILQGVAVSAIAAALLALALTLAPHPFASAEITSWFIGDLPTGHCGTRYSARRRSCRICTGRCSARGLVRCGPPRHWPAPSCCSWPTCSVVLPLSAAPPARFGRPAAGTGPPDRRRIARLPQGASYAWG